MSRSESIKIQIIHRFIEDSVSRHEASVAIKRSPSAVTRLAKEFVAMGFLELNTETNKSSLIINSNLN
jgi:hypothetical protein